MRCAAAPLLLTAFVAGAARAQTAEAFMKNPAFQDPPPRNCDSTFGMQHCAAHDLRAADARMSAAYFRARDRLAAGPRADLLRDQRAWLAFRDRECLVRGHRQGEGSLGPVMVALCWVDVTRARAKALEPAAR